MSFNTHPNIEKIWNIYNKKNSNKNIISENIIIKSDEDFSATIIDPYDGYQPILITRSILAEKKELTVAFKPTILLDSNITQYLDAYVTKRLDDKPRVKSNIRELICIFEKLGYDYNPIFSYMELIAKSSEENRLRSQIKQAESILKLHTMKTDAFLDSGDILLDDLKLEYYRDAFRAQSIHEIAKKMVTQDKIPKKYLEPLCLPIYMCLLKMVLVENNSKLSFHNKVELYYLWLLEEVGVKFAREFAIAIDYFSGELKNFLPRINHTSTSKEKILKKLHASSWDLYFLRLPELFLSFGDIEETVLLYPCTADKALQLIGSTTKTRGLSVSNGVPNPLLEIDLLFYQNNSSAITKDFDDFIDSMKVTRNQNPDTTNLIIKNLEHELDKKLNLI